MSKIQLTNKVTYIKFKQYGETKVMTYYGGEIEAVAYLQGCYGVKEYDTIFSTTQIELQPFGYNSLETIKN